MKPHNNHHQHNNHNQQHNHHQQQIYVNISDVASFIGQNKWDQIMPFERLWKKYDPEYKMCIDEYNRIITEEYNEEMGKIQEKRKENKITEDEFIAITERREDMLTERVDSIELSIVENIQKQMGVSVSDEIVKTIHNPHIDTSDKKKITRETIKNKMTHGKKYKEDDLLRQTNTLINQYHGTLKEYSAIRMYEMKYDVILDTKQKYYSCEIGTIDSYKVFIGGKMDGIYWKGKDESYVVEVKNRIRGFFTSVREYEYTQIQLYMYMLDFPKGKLIEKYKNEIKVTDINFDQECITSIITHMNVFIKNVIEFWNNFNMKLKYIGMSDNEKKQFIYELSKSTTCNESNEDKSSGLLELFLS